MPRFFLRGGDALGVGGVKLAIAVTANFFLGAMPFLREKSYNHQASLGLTLGGIPGVLLAAYVFSQLSVRWILWLVIGVSLITAINLWRSAHKKPNGQK